MSDNPQEEPSAVGGVALSLLGDPNFQKALTDMAMPMIQTQEAVLQRIIDSQNQINNLFVQLVEKMENLEVKLDSIIKEVNK